MGLPGQINRNPSDENPPCQFDGCGNLSTHYLIIEADSFGEEREHYCNDHIQTIRATIDGPPNEVDHCDHCSAECTVYPTRDPEEGMYGAVYRLCHPCREAMVNHFCDEE